MTYRYTINAISGPAAAVLKRVRQGLQILTSGLTAEGSSSKHVSSVRLKAPAKYEPRSLDATIRFAGSKL